MIEGVLAALVPPGLSPAFAFLLVGISLLTSALTAAVGIGGGLTLLAVMATGMPVAALIPLHGVVQLGSNAGRVVVQRRNVAWIIAGWFLAGSLVGALLGGRFVVTLPDAYLKGAIGLFVLAIVWLPKPPVPVGSARGFAPVGLVTTFLTMFVGATGPFVAAATSRAGLDRHGVVGTTATLMTIQHALKIAVFGLLGFAYLPWAGLLVAMIASGFVGTLIGTALLHRLPERGFVLAFKVLLTLLALDLLRGAFF